MWLAFVVHRIVPQSMDIDCQEFQRKHQTPMRFSERVSAWQAESPRFGFIGLQLKDSQVENKVKDCGLMPL